MNNNDTIVAISTPLGEGGIGIVRLSGPNSINIVNRFFSPKKNSKLYPKTHYLYYGFIKDEYANIIDEVLVSFMKAPRSYTKEDVVEINCHSGIIPLRKILEIALKNGARLAEPGEFTKRAFLNGRIDLVQAEGILNLINAKTERALFSAVDHLNGTLSIKVKTIRDNLLDCLSHIEATIDFEDDVPEIDISKLLLLIEQQKDELSRLLDTFNEGKILHEGLKTAIIGKPNVGKSSLMNVMVREQKAIVTDIPGTTRDIIEEYINLNGYPLKLMDTAGIRKTSEKIEEIGINRAKLILKEADLILLMLDGFTGLTNDDYKIMELISGQATIILINKIDIANCINIDDIKYHLPEAPILQISIKESLGIKDLESKIFEMLINKGNVPEKDNVIIASVRQKEVIKKALVYLKNAINGINMQDPIDLISIEIREAWMYLGKIIGEAIEEEIVQQIFSKFCVGK